MQDAWRGGGYGCGLSAEAELLILIDGLLELSTPRLPFLCVPGVKFGEAAGHSELILWEAVCAGER